MRISLLTDAPKHNLALMKLSAWHKAQGDTVILNMPLWRADKTYASVLFTANLNDFHADEYGGPAYVSLWMRTRRGAAAIAENTLPATVEAMVPDYALYPELGCSLGYTYRPCHRGCEFCIVGNMAHPDTEHHSIWEFHNPRFEKICLLNNNTFADPHWRETFEEIWDADLSVIDENGYDLRLLDDEKTDALHRTQWASPLHFAWDHMKDEALVRRGLKLLEKHHLRSTAHGVYVLIGYNTSEAEDIHRCQVISDHGLTPYPMPYVRNDYTRRFKRFINLHYYRQHSTVADAWKDYQL